MSENGVVIQCIFFTSADELELFCKSIKSTGNNKNNFMELLY
jgi:hypothetical protein